MSRRQAVWVAIMGSAAGGCTPQSVAGLDWRMGLIVGGAGLAGVVASMALGANRRLRRELAKRVKEAEISEERHRLLLAQSSDAIMVADADTGAIIEANRYACELLGWRDQELVGRNHTTLYPVGERDTVRNTFAKHATAGGISEANTRVLHRAGEAIPVNVRASLITSGARRYVQAVMRDLRPRERAEDALRRSESHLRELVERAPVAILEQDFTAPGAWLEELRAQGVKSPDEYIDTHPGVLAEQFARIRVVGANPAALRMTGVPDLETYVLKMPSTVTAEVLNAFRLELLAIWEGRTEVVSEISYRRLDGSVGQGVLHWRVAMTGGRADLARVLVAISDLTQLRAMEARLQEVEDRWELAVRGLNVGIFEQNYVTGETYLSDRWKEMLGYAAHELPTRRQEWQSRVHPEDRPRAVAAMHAHLRRENEFYQVEYRIRCKDGGYKWIMARGRAVFAPDGRALRLIGAHADISERKAAEAAISASEARHRELFDRSPVAILEEDFTAVKRWLDENGVRTAEDLDGLIARDHGALVRAYGQVRLVAANRSALAYLGAASLGELVPRKYVNPPGGILQAFRRELEAVLASRDETVLDVEFAGVDGRTQYQTLRWSVMRREDGQLELTRVLVALIDITELKEAEEAKRRAEDRWQLAVRGTRDGIWEYDFVSRRSFYSDRWKEMLGYAPGEVSDAEEEWTKRIHPEDLVRTMEASAAHNRGETTFFDTEFRMRCKDGSYKWILSRGQAQFDDEGKPVRSVGSHADITARKLAEEAIRASEERYRGLFEQSPVAIVEQDFSAVTAWMEGLRAAGVSDLAGYLEANPGELETAAQKVVVVGMNRETVRLARAGSKQELMENLGRVFTLDTLAARRDAFLALWEGRSEVEGEVTLHTMDGAARRLFFRWWVPRTEGRENLTLTQVVLIDLTDIRETEAELAAERQRLRVTLRAMAEGLLTTDTEGVVHFMNGAAERLTGWTAGAAIGRRIEEICTLRHEKTRAAMAMPVTQSISEHRVIDFPLQTTLVSREGNTCMVDGRCAPMHDVTGKAIGAVVVFRDTTERSRLEAELLRSSKLESVGILAGGIAHDFNNLLTVVMGNVTLAMLDSQVMAAAGRWLEEAERGVMRARDLTQQLLTFARGGEPIRKAVLLPEVVRDAAEFALHGSSVRCEFDIAEGLWPADVDKGQIGQVVQNLVINAVQAMPEGGVMRVRVANELDDAALPPSLGPGKFLRLAFADGGSGIRAEHLARIFDPYFTTKQSGSGLGLATVYSIVRKHQGHVEVESELGKGTTFHVWLPAAPDAKPAPPEDVTKIVTMSGRVLFMDDEETIRSVAKMLLARLGFEVVTAADGDAALAAYQAARDKGEPFRFVIMDLTIPGGMGGHEAMKELLKIDPEVKAIVSSGYSSDPVLSNYRAHGFSGMVPKPYKLTDLARTIRSVLGEDGK